MYGGDLKEGQRRYSPSAFVSAEKKIETENPDVNHHSTSYVERQSLTMRMSYFTRLSKHLVRRLKTWNMQSNCILCIATLGAFIKQCALHRYGSWC